jgi:hypothetical protein
LKPKTTQQDNAGELEVLSGSRAGERIRLVDSSYVIGSDEAAAITCADPEVEWSHARIYRDRDRYWVEDLQSRGGVLVNEKRTLHRRLSSGDTIRIGSAQFRFEMPGEREKSTAAAAAPVSVADVVAQVVEGVAPGASAGAAPVPQVVETASAEARPLAGRQEEALDSLRANTAPAGEAAAPAAGPVAAPVAEAPLFPPAVEASPAPSETEQRLREEIADLKLRCGALEQELNRKREGLSLATESFVEQLERAKERIASFARRHAETEALVRARDEEIERLRADYRDLEARSGAQVRDLIDKLDAARREFDELAKIAAHKGTNLARLVAEAKTALPRTLAAPGVPGAPGPEAAAAEAGAALRRASTSPAIRAFPTSEIRRAYDSGSREGAAAGAAAKTAIVPVPPPEGTGGAAFAAEARRNVRAALGSRLTRYAAAFLVIVGAVFALVWLAGSGFGDGRPPTQRLEKPPIVLPKKAPANGGAVAGGKLPAPPQKLTTPLSPAPKPGTLPAPVAAPPQPAEAAPQAGVDEGELFAGLRAAHRARDDKQIADEERKLIAMGKAILEKVNDAYQKERQFNLKVSLQFILFALEGKDSARDIVDAMRAAKDPGEKMRLAFMLPKVNRPEDLPFYEEALASEQDPMIKKYLVKALGKIEGARGIDVLKPLAQAGQDRSIQMEALRAIEEKKTPEAAAFLMDLANSAQDAAIKTIAVRAVASSSGREAASFFQKVLEQDERTNNRAEAAKYYARVGDASDLPLLEQLHAKERVYYIRQKIRQAIEAIQKRAGIEPATPPGGEPPPSPQEAAAQADEPPQ